MCAWIIVCFDYLLSWSTSTWVGWSKAEMWMPIKTSTDCWRMSSQSDRISTMSPPSFGSKLMNSFEAKWNACSRPQCYVSWFLARVKPRNWNPFECCSKDGRGIHEVLVCSRARSTFASDRQKYHIRDSTLLRYLWVDFSRYRKCRRTLLVKVWNVLVSYWDHGLWYWELFLVEFSWYAGCAEFDWKPRPEESRAAVVIPWTPMPSAL